jgi:peptidoglycan/LPS O-acetylase OafA/YrhL
MQKSRIFGLDILRCLAIVSVLYAHSFTVFDVPLTARLPRIFGLDGVSLFFVLSGFLIGGILIKTLDTTGPSLANLRRFWVNRWLRTLPAYYVIITLIAIGSSLQRIPPKGLYRFYFFLQDFKTGLFGFFGESWSLCVEEWFYLLIPPMAFLMAKRRPLRQAIPIIIGLVIVSVNFVRIYKVHHYHIAGFEAYAYDLMMTVPTRLDALMYGVLGAYLSFYKFPIWKKYNNVFLISGIVILIGNNIYVDLANIGFYENYLQATVIAIGALLLLPKLESVKVGSGILARIITFISLTSYSIYLTHCTLFYEFIYPHLPGNSLLKFAAYLTWAFGAGYLLYITVEKWGMRLRSRVNQQKKQMPAQKVVDEQAVGTLVIDPGNLVNK